MRNQVSNLRESAPWVAVQHACDGRKDVQWNLFKRDVKMTAKKSRLERISLSHRDLYKEGVKKAKVSRSDQNPA
jgi:hypothetical protein